MDPVLAMGGFTLDMNRQRDRVRYKRERERGKKEGMQGGEIEGSNGMGWGVTAGPLTMFRATYSPKQ